MATNDAAKERKMSPKKKEKNHCGRDERQPKNIVRVVYLSDAVEVQTK